MIIAIDKPAGISTHASSPDPTHEGSVEAFSRVLGKKLLVCHRLDKETSGCLLFATTSEDAAAVGAQFEDHVVEKSYLFITDLPRVRCPDKFSVSSHIEKKGGRFVSEQATAALPANSQTEFELVREQDGYSLWRARPRTGKPHQIRLHAQANGLAILGDRDHGGSQFPGLMLLSEGMVFRSPATGDRVTHSVQRSRLMLQLALCKNSRVAGWVLAIEKRERWLRSLKAINPTFEFGDTIRLVHTEGGSLRVDQLGETVALQWFTDDGPIHKREDADVRELISLMGWKQWHLQLRTDRGKKPENADRTSEPAPATRWIAYEHAMKFEFRLDSSLSTGLFLDQRANRRWVHANAKDKSVLNLFSYTGGFSVAAALGGARDVISVDLSKNFIEWSKRNFELNGLDPEQSEFRAFDSREFLKIAAKKRRMFDLVICDPPSFSRSENGVFRIEKDLPQLLISLREVLAPQGTILFATNFEGWSPEDFKTILHKEADRLQMRSRSTPPVDWDFALTSHDALMKSVLLSKS